MEAVELPRTSKILNSYAWDWIVPTCKKKTSIYCQAPVANWGNLSHELHCPKGPVGSGGGHFAPSKAGYRPASEGRGCFSPLPFPGKSVSTLELSTAAHFLHRQGLSRLRVAPNGRSWVAPHWEWLQVCSWWGQWGFTPPAFAEEVATLELFPVCHQQWVCLIFGATIREAAASDPCLGSQVGKAYEDTAGVEWGRVGGDNTMKE